MREQSEGSTPFKGVNCFGCLLKKMNDVLEVIAETTCFGNTNNVFSDTGEGLIDILFKFLGQPETFHSVRDKLVTCIVICIISNTNKETLPRTRKLITRIENAVLSSVTADAKEPDLLSSNAYLQLLTSLTRTLSSLILEASVNKAAGNTEYEARSSVLQECWVATLVSLRRLLIKAAVDPDHETLFVNEYILGEILEFIKSYTLPIVIEKELLTGESTEAKPAPGEKKSATGRMEEEKPESKIAAKIGTVSQFDANDLSFIHAQGDAILFEFFLSTNKEARRTTHSIVPIRDNWIIKCLIASPSTHIRSIVYDFIITLVERKCKTSCVCL
jgi:hypothetical protein